MFVGGIKTECRPPVPEQENKNTKMDTKIAKSMDEIDAAAQAFVS